MCSAGLGWQALALSEVVAGCSGGRAGLVVNLTKSSCLPVDFELLFRKPSLFNR